MSDSDSTLQTTSIRNIKSYDLYKPIQLEGVVTKSIIGKSRIRKAAFKCTCSMRYDIIQTEQFLEYPSDACEECKGRAYTLWREESEYTDIQIIAIQESPENLPAGETPVNIEIELHGDLVNVASPGDRVTIVGTAQVLQKSKKDQSLDLKRNFIAESVVVDNRTDYIGSTSDEEIAQFHEWVKESGWIERLSESISPMTYGYGYIKKSIALIMASSEATTVGIERRRGDSHMLLIGDPGTNKTQFIMFASKLSPRGIFVTAGGVTRVGLTASATKADDQWTIEAGAIVLADKGVCCIDEIDKMRDDDRGALHPAMEQQIVTKHAAGMAVTLNARCSVIATANPKNGNYDDGLTVLENIDMDSPLLSRFDLIFIIRDIPDEKTDREIARTILNRGTSKPDTIPVELLRKFFSYSKQVKPTLSKAVEDYIMSYYVEIRKKTKYNSNVRITPRQLESLDRLTRASARLHLREEATLEDVGHAIELYNRTLQDAGVDPITKEINVALMMTGKSTSKPKAMRAIRQWIESEIQEGGHILYEDVISGIISTGKYTPLTAPAIIDAMENASPALILRNGDQIKPC